LIIFSEYFFYFNLAKGGIAPGSMPSFSNYLEEEGVAFKSFKLVENGIFQLESLEKALLHPPLGTRNLKDNICDL